MALLRRIKTRLSSELDLFKFPMPYNPSEPSCSCNKCPVENSGNLKRNITFLYSKGSKNLASVQMRIPQSANHISFLNQNIRIRGLALQSKLRLEIKNEIIILTKFAARHISEIEIRELLLNGNLVYVDPIDAEIELIKFQEITGLIASSVQQEKYFKTNSDIPTYLIYHPSDFRLKDVKAQKDFFSLAYFGSISRLPHPADLLTFCDVVKTPLSYQPNIKLPEFSDKLKEYSCHLAIGPEQPKFVFKPFTKGLIASAVGAVTLISRNETEALSLLGADYPYVSADSSLKSISIMANFMKQTFNREEWSMAQLAHDRINEFTCELYHAQKWSQVLMSK